MLDGFFSEAAPLRAVRAIGCGCLIVLLTWLFADVVWFDHRLAFRDVAHFYGPLSRLVQAEWSAGRMPLWNPYTGIGVPLAASPTAAAFYPVQFVSTRLLSMLPLSPARVELAYVLVHLLLCAGATYVLARELGSAVAASLLAAIAYACSGSVLFQYCNIVFLVGAAWLPAALWATRRLVHRRQMKYAFTLGAMLALMTLGGDPQMAYHVGLFITGYVIVQWLAESRDRRHQPDSAAGIRLQHVGRRVKLLIVAAATALVLAAVQWIPALELTRLSTRGMPEYPRNVYQLGTSGFGTRSELSRSADTSRESAASAENEHAAHSMSTFAALLGRNEDGDAHQRQTYRFSVAPWHFAEFCIPNFSGQLFPTNQRWIRTLAAEGRTWVPSLYMGLIPALLALACLGPGADRQTRRLAWFTCFCLLAASGKYAPGWIARETITLLGVEPDRLAMGDAMGGAYWTMVNLLPGYETFRYPGKWLVPATLGMALLAAKGWDRRDRNYWTRVTWLGRGTLLTSLVLCVAVANLYLASPEHLASVPIDRVFGPLDMHGVWRGLMQGLIHAAVVAGFVAWMAGEIRRRSGQNSRGLQPDVETVQHEKKSEWRQSPARRFAVLVLVMTTLDLAVAQKPLVGTAPEESWQTTSVVAREVRKHGKVAGKAVGVPPRISRAKAWRPELWSRESDRDRFAEVVRWDRATLYPLYQFDERIDVVNNTGTMQLADFSAFHAQATSISDRQRKHGVLRNGTGLDVLSVECFVGPREIPTPRTKKEAEDHLRALRTAGPSERLVSYGILIDDAPTRSWEDVRLQTPRNTRPRVWIAHQWEERTLSQATSFREIQRRTANTLHERQVPRDLRTRPIVEAASPLAPPPPALADEQLAAEACRIVHYDPQQVDIEVTLHAAGLVVLADQFYPGWYARVVTIRKGKATRPLDIVRVNRVLRGVWLPPGEHRLTYSYRPNSVLLGATVSSIGWLSLLVVLIAIALRRSLWGMRHRA